MRLARFLLLSLVFFSQPCVSFAQTNTDPVVMPPVDQAPPPPPNSSPDSAPASSAPGSPAPSNPLSSGTPNPTSNQDEILDIRPPLFFLHPWLWLWIALAVVGLAALVAALWFLLRPRPAMHAKSAYDLALENLERARALMRVDNPMPYAVAVSEAIRTYLSQRFQTTSTRSTTEEFLRRMQSDSATPLAEHRELLSTFLRSCDLVKFARYQPDETELEKVQQSAVRFVTATKPAPVGSQNGHTP
jgi:hypothetical protein